MARTALTVPSAYTPDGVKANYDANIAASNDNFEELYGVETQTITTTPANITMPIVVLAYATGGAKVVKLPAVANTTLRRINVTKTVGVTSTATISPQTGEYLDGVQNGTLAMTDLGLSVTFIVIDGKWVSDWVGKNAGAPDGQNVNFKPGGTDKHFVFQTDVAAGGKLKIVDTTGGITDEYPTTWIQANLIGLSEGSSYIAAKLKGRSDGALVVHNSSAGSVNIAADTGVDLIIGTDAGNTLKLKSGTYVAELSADSSSRLVSTSGFAGSGAGLTDVPDSALSANVPLLDAANAYTNTNTVTVPTGTALIGTSEDYTGVKGIGAQYGVIGEGVDAGVTGNGDTGVQGNGISFGVLGCSENVGVYGLSDSIGVSGRSSTGIGVSGTGTISETLLGDLSANTGTSTAWADGDNTKLWFAQKFTAGATATATAISLRLAKGSAVAPTLATSTITAYIHADSTGAVGSVLAGGTGTAIRFDALTSTTPAEFYFGGMSASLTQGVSYWIVVKASAFETSAGSIVHDSKSATAGTYGTYNTGTSTWDYTAELAAWCKVHSAGGVGISGTSTIGDGVVGTSTTGYGGSFTSTRSRGVYGLGQTHGVYGETQTSVVGTNYGIYGVAANSSGYGVGGNGSYGGGFFTGVTRGIDVTQTTGRSVITQTAASSTNEALLITRTSGSNGTGPILLLNNAGSAVSGNLITAQTGGVDKFTVGVDGTIASASPSATLKGAPVSVWRGASSAEPSTDLVDGQLYFDTDVNTLYVYYSSAWHPCFVAP